MDAIVRLNNQTAGRDKIIRLRYAQSYFPLVTARQPAPSCLHEFSISFSDYCSTVAGLAGTFFKTVKKRGKESTYSKVSSTLSARSVNVIPLSHFTTDKKVAQSLVYLISNRTPFSICVFFTCFSFFSRPLQFCGSADAWIRSTRLSR